MQNKKGLVGALIVEPAGSTFTPDSGTSTSGTVKEANGHTFREFVVVMQTSISASSVDSAFNYRSEPTPWRYTHLVGTSDITQQLSNTLVAADPNRTQGDPNTPIFTAPAGQAVRFRVLYPAGDVIEDQVFAVNGHSWQEQPYIKDSTSIGANPKSQLLGAQQISPNERFDALITSAGGDFRIPGDYLFSTFLGKKQGLWGVFRVTGGADGVRTTRAQVGLDGKLAINGVTTVNPNTGTFADAVTVYAQPKRGELFVLGSALVGPDGSWKFESPSKLDTYGLVHVRSSFGGSDTVQPQR
jgi:hypothetical protein